MPSAIETAFTVVVGSEGGLSMNENDPGNWSGGAKGVGELKGTKYGVSAKAYPNLDIANLTLDQARIIFKEGYWNKVQGDALPAPLALIVVDAAYNNGPSRAAKWLQLAAGAAQDGIIGPATLAAVAKKSTVAVMVEFMAQRTLFMMSLPTATTFGLGWARRLAALPFAAMALEPKSEPQPPLAPQAPLEATINAIEIAMRRILEDHALAQAIAQRPAP